MSPSNANTSGLEVVAHRMRQLHHEIDGPITGWMYCPPSQHPSGNARWDVEPLVTAASAQARIAELVRRRDELLVTTNAYQARYRAAEARADETAGYLRDLREEFAKAIKESEARADRLAKVVVDLKAAFGDQMTRRALGGHNEKQMAAILSASAALAAAPVSPDSDLLKEAVVLLVETRQNFITDELHEEIDAFLSKVEERGHD